MNWRDLGSITVSVIVAMAFITAMVIAYLAKNDTMLTMLFGVVAGAFTSVVGYWIGSSIGSTRKDDALQASSLKKEDIIAKVVEKSNA